MPPIVQDPPVTPWPLRRVRVSEVLLDRTDELALAANADLSHRPSVAARGSDRLDLEFRPATR